MVIVGSRARADQGGAAGDALHTMDEDRVVLRPQSALDVLRRPSKRPESLPAESYEPYIYIFYLSYERLLIIMIMKESEDMVAWSSFVPLLPGLARAAASTRRPSIHRLEGPFVPLASRKRH